MSDWPIIEQPLCDHLQASTSFPWTIEGGHLNDRKPLGIVQVSGGGHDLNLEHTPDVEVTLIGPTRDGLWQMARQVDRAMVGLNPGGIHPHEGTPVFVDEVATVFGWRIDPDRGTSTYRVATATFNITLRPQGDDEAP